MLNDVNDLLGFSLRAAAIAEHLVRIVYKLIEVGPGINLFVSAIIISGRKKIVSNTEITMSCSNHIAWLPDLIV